MGDKRESDKNMKPIFINEKGFLLKRTKILISVLLAIVIICVIWGIYNYPEGYYDGLKLFQGSLLIYTSSNSTATIFKIVDGNDTLSPSTPFIIRISPPSGGNVTFVLNDVKTPINNTIMTYTSTGEKIWYTIWINSTTGNKYLARNDTITISQKIINITNPYKPLSNGTQVTFIYRGITIFSIKFSILFLSFALILSNGLNVNKPKFSNIFNVDF